MFIPSATEEERKSAKMEKRNQANSSFIMKQPQIKKNYHHNHYDHSSYILILYLGVHSTLRGTNSDVCRKQYSVAFQPYTTGIFIRYNQRYIFHLI